MCTFKLLIPNSAMRGVHVGVGVEAATLHPPRLRSASANLRGARYPQSDYISRAEQQENSE